MYFYSSGATRLRRFWSGEIAADYRGFVESVQVLPTPPPGETLFFKSMPQLCFANIRRKQNLWEANQRLIEK
jgi:hypothetical protein